MHLNKNYNREDFLDFIEKSFLQNFRRDIRPINIGNNSIQKAYSLGRDEGLDLQVFEFISDRSLNNRVSLTKEAFNIMKSSATFNALAIFHTEKSEDWRFSLMTANPERTEAGKVTMAYSNPRRYSYFLGPNSRINTPTKYLVKKEKIIDFDDLKGRFSIEVVNKDFYKQISDLFMKLVGGTTSKGKQKTTHEALLQLPFKGDKSRTCLEFAVRLIGRIIFCWFLREKVSQSGKSLMPKELLSLDAVNKNDDYYHKILEPIFFEVLNKPLKSRKERYIKEPFSLIPYLNGGLFSPQEDDFFSYREDQAINHNILKIPNKWFKDFFEALETYNFTIDENISFDEELSIDPEMLGRIFENLLAEINPETGESARKSTGSYYTPRPIVDYMVDESIFLYLQTKTGIEEKKLRAAISYNIDDDLQYPLSNGEKENIVNALEEVKILDPACGSGAFPIGALQKIIFILQQLDPEGQLWFQKQIKNTAPEIKRVLEREFKNKNFDYIRKLGVIRENIYGVDIQPIATEISRLRCFLTLIVDESIHDELENRGIEPLPNLDFKFVTANTLIGLPKPALNENQTNMFEDAQGISELKELRNMFFTASGTEREMLKLRFVQAQNKMFQRLIKDGRTSHAELTTHLSTWDPFSHESSYWFDEEWMFGIKSGFDIIIANPPYVGQKNNNQLFQTIKKSLLGKYHQRRMDLFYFFFHFALNTGRTNSIISFITTNYYLTATSADKLRSDFKERASVKNLLNFNELKIFESAQGQHNMITILQKRKDGSPIAKSCITQRHGLEKPEILDQIINGRDDQSKYYTISQDNLYEGKENYIRFQEVSFEGENNVQSILNKIKVGENLGHICYVSTCIQTGADKLTDAHIKKYNINGVAKGEGIFVLNKDEWSSLELSDEEKTHLKPWFKNSDIFKWYTNDKTSERLIYLTSKNSHKDIGSYLKHFKKYKPILINRNTRSGTATISDEDYENFKNNLKEISYVMIASAFKRGDYFCVSYARDPNVFIGPKIVVPQRSPSNIFGYNENPWYAGTDIHIIANPKHGINLKYILALLNSKLYYFWLYHRGKRKGETLELVRKPLSEIPILKISEDRQIHIIKIVDEILSISKLDAHLEKQENKNKLKEYEKQIDHIVYKLYDLTQEEIDIVENKTK